jgi:hypothetical protein
VEHPLRVDEQALVVGHALLRLADLREPGEVVGVAASAASMR